MSPSTQHNTVGSSPHLPRAVMNGIVGWLWGECGGLTDDAAVLALQGGAGGGEGGAGGRLARAGQGGAGAVRGAGGRRAAGQRGARTHALTGHYTLTRGRQTEKKRSVDR